MKAQKIYLEHANITVSDLEKSVHFFQTAFPHFVVRGGGKDLRKWIHLGDNETYIAINELIGTKVERENYDDLGINHLGFVVEDVNEIGDRLLKNGYKRDYPKQIEKYRIRDYFADSDGNQFEFVEYLTEKTEEKNFYD